MHDLRKTQGQRAVYCVNHRTMRERSSGTDRLNVDVWIETEVAMQKECAKAEMDREVTAWEDWEEQMRSSMGESERETGNDERGGGTDGIETREGSRLTQH